jgi:DNA-binding transcriptional ArsR family regulator
MHTDTFETLADPTRRLLLDALLAGERQVGELVAEAGIHQSGVSRHLRILHEAGFVTVTQARAVPRARYLVDAVPGLVGGAARSVRRRAREAEETHLTRLR